MPQNRDNHTVATKPSQQTALIAKLSIFIQFETSWAAAA
jgi:hypothetical protein